MATPGDKERGLPSPTQQAFPQQQQQQQQQPAAQTQQQQLQQQHQQHQQRPSSRRFSFLSDKSRKAAAATNKIDLHETHSEKDSRRLHSKADPTMAMNEAEPSVEAVMTASSRPPLRSIQHKDAYGNVIADPDLSNPTRNRWERPLDTIRSFEAAIEGDFVRRSMHRSETDPSANFSRRNSYYRANQPRFPQDSYYGSRAASFRGDGSQLGPPPMTTRNSYYDNQHYSNNGGYYTAGAGPSGGRRPSREQTSKMAMASEPQLRTYGREQNVYPIPHKDRSYETVTSAAASGSSDPAGYQTDPTSSDNSSIHRTSPAKQVNDYGIAFSQSQSYKPPVLTVNVTTPASKMPTPPNASYQNPQSAVPRKDATLLKRQVSTTPSGGDKRKSWFSRRFSKNS